MPKLTIGILISNATMQLVLLECAALPPWVPPSSLVISYPPLISYRWTQINEIEGSEHSP